ncbi:MAG: polysaccharide deacetylase family protein [Clostridia bacterium]|nr:polysaccharide deacetylase family protein [Clostridia bacterium]
MNSGLFGDKTYEGRIGNMGITEMPAARFEAKKHHLLPYVPHFRIPENELRDVYAGFEIASHTVSHMNMARCSEEERLRQVRDDVTALSGLFGQTVTGFAYPYGAGANVSRSALQAAGIRYARLATAPSQPSFRFPEDPLAMPLTCWHIAKKTFPCIEQFLMMKPGDDDLFFLMFAHGYEFDFGTKESNWEKLERICQTVSRQPDVICCSIGEAFRRHEKGE